MLGCVKIIKKMARRYSAKQIYKSKCKKHLCFVPLLEIPMSQKYKTEAIAS